LALQEYKCPCCGGALEFNTAVQRLKCPYCDTEFDMETLSAYDAELQQDAPDSFDWNPVSEEKWAENENGAIRVYVCQSCGGEIVGDETLSAMKCPYCDNPVVVKEHFSGLLKPDYVIPFKLNKEQAKEGLRKHLSGKKLLPKVFKDENHIDEIKGVYVPFWLFDADVDAHMRYRMTRVRMWHDSNFNYTETSYFSGIRAGNIGFDHVPVDGSSKMADDLMESLEPFDFSEAVDFQTAYLAGYLADKYDVDAGQSIGRANERIKRSTEQAFAGTVQGYASVLPEYSNVSLLNGQTKYALYPVWLLNTTWRGQKYTFAMNGQTGKFVGNLPIDKGAYLKWLLGLTGVIGAGKLAAMYLMYLL